MAQDSIEQRQREMTGEPSIEQRQRDIEFGNSYRLEYIKHLITIASGMFVFTVAFMKDVIQKPAASAHWPPVLIAGWLALVISIIAGIYHMRYWAWYFVSWGRGPGDATEIAWRNRIDTHRIIAERVQFYGFFVGLGCLLLFAALNLY
jgi:hypothetical protein